MSSLKGDMAATNSSHPSHPSRSQVHIPKLMYRKPSTASSTPSTLESEYSLSLHSTSSISTFSVPNSPLESQNSLPPPSPIVPTKRFNQVMPTGSSPLKPQVELQPEDARNASKAKKSKASSLRNFFGAKEPSTQAWLDYQNTLRKQQAAHNGRSAAVGLPMVSTAKLPANVPKVNSKWDGVPEAVKDKEKALKRQTATAHARPPTSVSYTRSNSMKKSTHSTRSSGTRGNRNSSTSSSSTGAFSSSEKVNTEDLTRNLVRIGIEGHGNISDSSPSTFSPSLPEFAPSFYMDMPVRGNSPLALYEITQRESTIESETPSFTMSPALTPSDFSPMTPPASSPFFGPGLPSQISTSEPGASNIQTTVLTLSPADKVVLNSSGPHILGPPVSALRKAKHMFSPNGEARGDSKPMFEIKSILKREATPARPSLSEYFPKTESTAKPNPASSASRERTVAPWESPESPEDGDNSERILTPTPQGTLGKMRMSRKPLFG